MTSVRDRVSFEVNRDRSRSMPFLANDGMGPFAVGCRSRQMVIVRDQVPFEANCDHSRSCAVRGEM